MITFFIMLLYVVAGLYSYHQTRKIEAMSKELNTSKEYLRHSFKGTVLSLTAKEIVQTMIDGLIHQWVKVDMYSYGDYSIGKKRRVCYGCAATNTICELIQQPFPCESIIEPSSRASFVHVDKEFLKSFEKAIDQLRIGNISGYNMYAQEIGISLLPNTNLPYLPTLLNDNWKRDIGMYQDFANSL